PLPQLTAAAAVVAPPRRWSPRPPPPPPRPPPRRPRPPRVTRRTRWPSPTRPRHCPHQRRRPRPRHSTNTTTTPRASTSSIPSLWSIAPSSFTYAPPAAGHSLIAQSLQGKLRIPGDTKYPDDPRLNHNHVVVKEADGKVFAKSA